MAGAALLLATAALLLTAAAGEGPTVRYDFTIGRQWVDPDGFNRAALTTNYNGALVGPLIRVQNGGRVLLNVTNESYQPITIHFHGIHMSKNQWMDGVAGGTQCGIPSGHSYLYNFTVQQSPGTYMWHGHYIATEADGLHGLLIVDPSPEEASAYEDLPKDELLVEIQDWYHLEARTLAEGLVPMPEMPKERGAGLPLKWPGNPQMLLINGKGIWNCSKDFDPVFGANKGFGFTYCSDVSYFEAVGTNNDRIVGSQTVWNVDPGKRYLMRIVNLATVQYMTFRVEGHNLTVVAADGHRVKPFTVPQLDVQVAERYDVILEANGQAGKTYRVVVGTKFRFSGGPSGAGPHQFANLTYSGAAGNSSAAPPPASSSSNTTIYGLVPYVPTKKFNLTNPNANVMDYFDPRWVRSLEGDFHEDLRGEADHQLVIDGYLWFTKEDYLLWTPNSIEFKNDPSGLALLPLAKSGVRNAGSKLLSNQNNVWTLELNKTYDIVFHNYGETWKPELGQIDEHPWHVHGYSFFVLGYGAGRYPGFANASRAGLLNLVDPPLRDMVTVFPGVMANGSVGLNLVQMPDVTKARPWVYNFSGTNLTADCYINDPRPDCALAAKPLGWSVIRLVADNPGVWNVHCHIVWHQVMAMQGYLITDVGKVPEMPREYAESMLTNCPAMGASMSTLSDVLNAAGHGDLMEESSSSPRPTVNPQGTSGAGRSTLGWAVALVLGAALLAFM